MKSELACTQLRMEEGGISLDEVLPMINISGIIIKPFQFISSFAPLPFIKYNNENNKFPGL